MIHRNCLFLVSLAMAPTSVAQEPAPTGGPVAREAKVESVAERARRAMELRRRRQLSLSLADDEPLPRLVEALDYDNGTVRRAAELLAARGLAARVAMARMARILDETSSRELQLLLVEGLLAIDPRHPASCAAHHDRLCNGTVLQRREAALALGALGAAAEPALRALISATREDSAPLVRDAVTALGMLGKTARPALRRLVELTESPDPQLRARAVVAVRQIHAAAGG